MTRKSDGRHIEVTRVSKTEFDIDITWDRDLLDIRNTPQRILGKPCFDAVSEKNIQDIEYLLNPIVTAKVEYPTEVFCEFIEEILANYFSRGFLAARLLRDQGPKKELTGLEYFYRNGIDFIPSDDF